MDIPKGHTTSEISSGLVEHQDTHYTTHPEALDDVVGEALTSLDKRLIEMQSRDPRSPI